MKIYVHTRIHVCVRASVSLPNTMITYAYLLFRTNSVSQCFVGRCHASGTFMH